MLTMKFENGELIYWLSRNGFVPVTFEKLVDDQPELAQCFQNDIGLYLKVEELYKEDEVDFDG